MLRDALTEFVRRDQEQAVDAFEGGVQRLRFAVVGGDDRDAPGGKIGALGGIAQAGDDLAGRDAFEQGIDGEAAELAAGGGDENTVVRHGGILYGL